MTERTFRVADSHISAEGASHQRRVSRDLVLGCALRRRLAGNTHLDDERDRPQKVVIAADVFVLDAARPSPRLHLRRERASALRLLLAEKTEPARRRELLEEYGIQQAVFTKREARWLQRWNNRRHRAGPYYAYELGPEAHPSLCRLA
jgi:hypothetical protein